MRYKKRVSLWNPKARLTIFVDNFQLHQIDDAMDLRTECLSGHLQGELMCLLNSVRYQRDKNAKTTDEESNAVSGHLAALEAYVNPKGDPLPALSDKRVSEGAKVCHDMRQVTKEYFYGQKAVRVSKEHKLSRIQVHEMTWESVLETMKEELINMSDGVPSEYTPVPEELQNEILVAAKAVAKCLRKKKSKTSE